MVPLWLVLRHDTYPETVQRQRGWWNEIQE